MKDDISDKALLKVLDSRMYELYPFLSQVLQNSVIDGGLLWIGTTI